jgi:DNA-binding GntR family transcriptional regulator
MANSKTDSVEKPIFSQDSNLMDIPPTISKSIAVQIEKAISLGQLAPGEKLVPDELARKLKISKSPVREALISLKETGLVISKPRQGFFVSEISIEDIHEIDEIKAVLNSLVIKIIFETGYGQNFIQRLEKIIQKMVEKIEAEDARGYFVYTNQLQNFYLNRCGNKRLQRILNNLGEKALRSKFLSLSHIENARRSFSLHKKILEAFKTNDKQAAMAAAEKIVNSASKALCHALLKENEQ